MIYLRAGCAPYRWKGLNEGYNFALGLKFGSLKTKWHLGARPMARHKTYYKGEGGGFPPSPGRGESCESRESVFACDLFVHQKCSNYALINL
jgi:hypothetical protein